MSLNGKLEDVPLADVMQFVHLGRRTGTLSLTRGRQEAEIGFHRGQIVSAWAPGSRRLGELLVADGLVDSKTLTEMLRLQTSEHPRRSLGQVLIGSGTLDFDQIREAIEEQIEQSIYELVTWTTGSFEFALDELKPIDDIAMYPGRRDPQARPQYPDGVARGHPPTTTRSATRRKRERRVSRSEAAPTEAEVEEEPAGDGQRMLGESLALSSVSNTLENLDVEIPVEGERDEGLIPEATHRRLQIVSQDVRLAEELERIIKPRDRGGGAGALARGRYPAAGGAEPDDRGARHAAGLLHARRPAGDPPFAAPLVGDRGGRLPGDDHPGLRVRRRGRHLRGFGGPGGLLLQPGADAAGGDPRCQLRLHPGGGFARLRRVLADIRSGLLSATMALNLMHIISESVERAVLFLVRRDVLDRPRGVRLRQRRPAAGRGDPRPAAESRGGQRPDPLRRRRPAALAVASSTPTCRRSSPRSSAARAAASWWCSRCSAPSG